MSAEPSLESLLLEQMWIEIPCFLMLLPHVDEQQTIMHVNSLIFRGQG